MVSPIEAFILNMKAAGFPLILLWLLVLSVVYGILSHINLPRSITARGVISIISAFMVLFAAAATAVTSFISTMISIFIVIAVGIFVLLIFFEMTQLKAGEKNVFSAHYKLFASALIILVIIGFISAGGLQLIGFPNIAMNETLLGIFLFLIIMILAVWVLVIKEEKK
ncbi:MAG: hypothetical protein KQA40_02585 [Candidatus Aenigmarchaeota archaeon]|nr:hypothetical protein [Candidatus Aenigmarchaeota archaeon]